MHHKGGINLADVRKYTEQIAKAQKGRDVRKAIVDAINTVSDENNLYNDNNEEISEIAKEVREVKESVENATELAEAWTHGHEKHPEQSEDNAKFYAQKAENEVKGIFGRVEEGKKDIDNYVCQKEAELKGETGNVHFAAFKVAKGRLKMYSDPTVDKVRFRRVGSRLKYRLKF